MFDEKDDTALKLVEFLLKIKAIILNPGNPFTWASGWKSPIYCDSRKTLSHPKIRTHIRQQLAKGILTEFGKIDAIVGVAIGGIPHGVLVSEELGLPFAYVRSSTKEHGLKNKIEGDLPKGKSVVVVEDLISTGVSSLNAVEAIKEYGCDVKGIASIFNYNFKTTKKNFKGAKCQVISLCNYDILIKQAAETGYIEKNDLIVLKEWREDPENWGKKENDG